MKTVVSLRCLAVSSRGLDSGSALAALSAPSSQQRQPSGLKGSEDAVGVSAEGGFGCYKGGLAHHHQLMVVWGGCYQLF